MTVSKRVKKTLNIITTMLVVIAVLLAVLLVGVRLVGLQPYTVLSGSMEPTYHTGSLIYVKEVEPEEVKVGQPITFVLNEDLVVATTASLKLTRKISTSIPKATQMNRWTVPRCILRTSSVCRSSRFRTSAIFPITFKTRRECMWPLRRARCCC